MKSSRIPILTVVLAAAFAVGMHTAAVAQTWTNTSMLASHSQGAAATSRDAANNEHVYVTGGWGGNSMSVFDPLSDTWSLAPGLQQVRRRHSATTLLDGRIVVMGGEDFVISPNIPTIYATIEIYDPQNPGAGWSTLSVTMPAGGRSGHSAIRGTGSDGKEKIFVIGGRDANGLPTNDEIFDVQSMVFTGTTATPPTVGGSHSVTNRCDGYIYVYPSNSTAYRYHTQTDTWDQTALLHYQNVLGNATVVTAPDGRIYAMSTGGRGPGDCPFGGVRSWAPGETSWRSEASLNGKHWEPFAATMSDRVFLITSSGPLHGVCGVASSGLAEYLGGFTPAYCPFCDLHTCSPQCALTWAGGSGLFVDPLLWSAGFVPPSDEMVLLRSDGVSNGITTLDTIGNTDLCQLFVGGNGLFTQEFLLNANSDLSTGALVVESGGIVRLQGGLLGGPVQIDAGGLLTGIGSTSFSFALADEIACDGTITGAPGTLDLQRRVALGSTGLLLAPSGATLNVALPTNSNGSIHADGGIVNLLESLAIGSGGTALMENGGRLTLAATSTNDGSIQALGSASLAVNSVLTTRGSMVVNGASAVTLTAPLLNEGSLTVDGSNAVSATGLSGIGNSASSTMVINGSGANTSITASTSVSQNSTADINPSGGSSTITAAFTSSDNATTTINSAAGSTFITGALTISGGTISVNGSGGSFTLGGQFHNEGTSVFNGGGGTAILTSPLQVFNLGTLEARPGLLNISGDYFALPGSFINVYSGAIVFVNSFVQVGGTWQNNGICVPCPPINTDQTPRGKAPARAVPAKITVLGNIELDAASTAMLGDAEITLLGNFDVAIDDPTRFDLRNTTVRLNGLAQNGDQGLELLSPDLGRSHGASEAGLFAIGRLEVGPATATIRLVDNRITGGSFEASVLYVRDLVLAQGVTLDLRGARLYYETVSPADPFAPGSGVTIVDSGGPFGTGGLIQMQIPTDAPPTADPTVSRLALAQNTPNPFNPRTVIGFDLPNQGHVSLVIYDERGKRVRTLVNDLLPAGHRDKQWDGKDDTGTAVSSGIYFYRLTHASGSLVQKMALIR